MYKIMKNKKLYEYVISKYLGLKFIKQISIDEQTKTVRFELIAIDVATDIKMLLIRDISDLSSERINLTIKDFLLAIIGLEAFRENIYNKTIEELENGFKVNDKEFLLEYDNFEQLKEKVLNEVKEYGLH